MKTTFILLYSAIIFILSYNLSGCKDDDIPIKPGNNDPGILRTDEFANILGGDTTDWCLNDSAGVSFGPAYPNPAFPTLRVKFRVPSEDTVMVYILRTNTDTVKYFNGRALPGYYEVTIDAAEFKNSYRRIYFKSKYFSSSQFCRFYGDIKIEE